MLSKRMVLVVVALSCLLALTPSSLFAQAASAGTIDGTVTDATGAAVAGATATLTDIGTNTSRTATTNEAGRYLFINVPPGTYNLTVNKTGFRLAKFTNQVVSVGTTLTLNVALEVGSVAQIVEVTATNADLQTMNATVGNTVSGVMLSSLPSIGRDASTFVTLQPGVAPDGSVAGAVYDQNSFTLDGGQNTNDMDGSMNIYTPSFAGDTTGGLIGAAVTGNAGGGPTGVMPTPSDSIEEFRVGTTNQTADFNSSAGAQVSMVTKRGGNSWHGTAYETYLDNNFNANTYDNNATSTPIPSYHFSRFGVAGGGPLIPKDIWGGKTFFFANYEGLRWPNSATGERAVPSDAMRGGRLYFARGLSNCGQPREVDGTPTYYNLNPTPVTFNGVTYPSSGLDPRHLGVSPIMQQLCSTMPLPNESACGLSRCDLNDAGLGNIGGFRGNYSVPQSDNFGVARLDHDFGSKWHFYSSYRYFKLIRTTTNQTLLSANGLSSLSSRPQVPWFLAAGLTTNVTNNFTNDFHYSYLRNYWAWGTAGAPPQITGLGGALEPLGETSTQVLAPYNVNTQSVRTRFWNGHDSMIRDDATWLKGSHIVQFGETYQRNWNSHQRTDNGGGINYYPVYQTGLTGAAGLNMTGFRPAGVTSAAWDRDYAMVLCATQLTQIAYTRKGPTLTLNPPLTPASDQSTIPYYNVYFSDSWRIKPTFTLTYGLVWTLEMPPVEANGKQVELVDSANQLVGTEAYIKSRETAALQGQVYNPTLGFALVGNSAGGLKYPYNPFYGSFSPRIAVACNPNVAEGTLRKAFGHGKTVVRGGYSRIFGRLNGVDLVLVPLLGTGLILPVQCFAPYNPAATAANGYISCGTTGTTNPNNVFRVGPTAGGWDGLTAPIPAANPTLPQPDFPGVNAIAAGAGEALDPNFRPNASDSFDLTIQRQLTQKTILEVGYIGRRITHEYQPVNINAVPYMMTVGGQRFDKAYAAAVMQYCGGNAGLAGGNCAGDLAAVTPQPFFETALGGSSSAYCSGFASCTAAVAFNEGLPKSTACPTCGGTGNLSGQNVWSLWSDLDNGAFNFSRTMMNTPIVGGPLACGTPAVPTTCGAQGQFSSGIGVNTSIGYGNYNALFVSYKMANWHGLTMQSNFTWGKALGTGATVQATSQFTVTDPYNISRGYGSQGWDRKFTYNIFFVYEPPFYKGQQGAIGRVLGGWRFAPIFTAASGLPLMVSPASNGNGIYGGSQSFGEADGSDFGAFESAVLICPNNFGNSRHNGVAGSGGVGTGGFGDNIFKDPAAALNCFRNPILGLDDGHNGGAGTTLRGLPYWNVDFAVNKNIKVNERFSAEVGFTFTNVFNHNQLIDPGSTYAGTGIMTMASPPDWGALEGQANTPRQMAINLRVRF